MRLTVKIALAVSLIALGATGVTSCGDASQPPQQAPTSTPSAGAGAYPVTITNCDKTYTYQRAPQRVVTGWPTTVDTLSDLGVGSSVVGYFAGEFGPPPRDITTAKLSDKYVPTTETILAARPDFFLANGDSQLKGQEGGVTYADLEKIGANTYIMGHDCGNLKKQASGVETLYEDVTNLGAIFDIPDKAKELNDKLRARVAAAKALRGTAEKPRVAYVGVFEDKLYALSGIPYSPTLDGVDAVNIFADLNESFVEISPEKVLTLDPDGIVFEWYPNIETEAEQKAKVVQRLGNSKAVRSGKVIGVPAHLSEGPGVAVIEAIELVAKGLYQ